MTKKPAVLIIDDDPINIRVLEVIFLKEGFKTYKAMSGPEGRALAQTEQPDLILLDIMMPGENGFEACRKLKKHPNTADIPVIFISALDQVKEKVTGLSIGAVDYVTKPFDKDEVLARVRVHIKLRRAYAVLIEEQSASLRQIQSAQQAILPQPQDYPEGRFAVFYKPLQEAGGDFYDALPIGNGLSGYFVADISGHGMGAAYITAALKVLVAQYVGPLFTPAETMRMINSVLHRILKEGQHLTACYAHLNRARCRLTLLSAGHPPAVFMSKNGKTEVLEINGDALGVFDTVAFETIEREVEEGDRVFLYTDGLIERKDRTKGSRREGINQLAAACRGTRTMPLEDAVRCIIGEMAGGDQALNDDVLLMAVEV